MLCDGSSGIKKTQTRRFGQKKGERVCRTMTHTLGFGLDYILLTSLSIISEVNDLVPVLGAKSLDQEIVTTATLVTVFVHACCLRWVVAVGTEQPSDERLVVIVNGSVWADEPSPEQFEWIEHNSLLVGVVGVTNTHYLT